MEKQICYDSDTANLKLLFMHFFTFTCYSCYFWRVCKFPDYVPQDRAKFRRGSSVGGFVAVSVSRWDGDKMLELLFGKTVCKVQEATQVSVVSAPSCEVSEGGFPHPLHLFRIAFLL